MCSSLAVTIPISDIETPTSTDAQSRDLHSAAVLGILNRMDYSRRGQEQTTTIRME